MLLFSEYKGTDVTIYGIRVDTDAIAQGIFDLCNADDLAVIAFGMTPAKFMLHLDKMLKQKFDDIAAASIGTTTSEIKQVLKQFDLEDVVKVDTIKRTEFVNSITRNVHCKLLILGNCRV